jgi:WD40 repeat protein
VRLWPLAGNPEGLRTSPAIGLAITALRFVPDAGLLVAADVGGSVWLWAWQEGAATGWQKLGVSPGVVGAGDLQVSDNRWWVIARSSSARSVQMFDLTRAHPGARDFPGVTAFAMRGRRLAFGTSEGQIGWVDLEKPELHHLGKRGGAVRALVITENGRRVIAGGDDRFAALWEYDNELPVAAFGGHDDPVEVLGLAAEDRRLLTSGSSGEPPRLWDLGGDSTAPAEPERLSRNSEPPAGLLQSVLARELAFDRVAVSPDGRWLAVGLSASGNSAEIHLWDFGTPASTPVLHVVRGHGQGVGALAFSPDGRLLVTGGRDGVIHLWHLEPVMVEKPVVLEPGGGEITAAALSGAWLAVAAGDRKVRMWQNPGVLGSQATPDRHLTGATESMMSLAIGPDSWVAAGGQEGSVYLWDHLQYPDIPIAVKKHTEAIRELTFKEDGRWLESTDGGDLTLRWRLHDVELKRFACQAVARNLTQNEWKDYFPGEHYHRTCKDLPAGD